MYSFSHAHLAHKASFLIFEYLRSVLVSDQLANVIGLQIPSEDNWTSIAAKPDGPALRYTPVSLPTSYYERVVCSNILSQTNSNADSSSSPHFHFAFFSVRRIKGAVIDEKAIEMWPY